LYLINLFSFAFDSWGYDRIGMVIGLEKNKLLRGQRRQATVIKNQDKVDLRTSSIGWMIECRIAGEQGE